jgi:hypothetical protein
MKAKLAVVAFGLAVTAALGTGTASAAPKPQPGLALTLNCPGDTYDGPFVVQGGGRWAPAFVGDALLLPVSFGVETGVDTTPDGSFPFTNPAVVQNAGKGGNHPRMECTYHFEATFGEFSSVGDGSAVVAVIRP